jgi:hypothetical protein
MTNNKQAITTYSEDLIRRYTEEHKLAERPLSDLRNFAIAIACGKDDWAENENDMMIHSYNHILEAAHRMIAKRQAGSK